MIYQNTLTDLHQHGNGEVQGIVPSVDLCSSPAKHNRKLLRVVDRLPREKIGRSRVDLKNRVCERERRRGMGSIPSWPCIEGAAEGAVMLEVVKLRVATEECGDAVAVLTTAVGESSRRCCASPRLARV
jgi:hypothetical protein